MPADADSTGGIGLSVIRALTETVVIERGDGGGTRVEMNFAAEREARRCSSYPRGPRPAGACHGPDETRWSFRCLR